MKDRRIFIRILMPLAVIIYLVFILIEREYQRERAQASVDGGVVHYPGIYGDLKIDPAGRLWAIFEGGEINIWDGSRWEHYVLPNYDRVNNYITSFAFDATGTAWLGTPTGLYAFDGQNWTLFTPQNSGVPWERVSALAVDASGTIWLASGMNGLAVCNERECYAYPLQAHLIDPIAIDGVGRVWIRNSGSSGLIMYQPGMKMSQPGSWNAFSSTDSELPGDTVYALAPDTLGRIWIGTDDGIAVVDKESWTTYTESDSSLPGKNIYKITFDEGGKAWAALGNDGFAFFDGTRWTGFSFENSGLFPGEVGISIHDIAVGPDGKVWLNTVGEGLLSISNLSNIKRISPLLFVPRPFTFHPEARWALPFFLVILGLGFYFRVQIPEAFSIALGIIPSIWYDGGIYLNLPYVRWLYLFGMCAIIGPICALLGGLLDVRKGRFGFRQRAGMIMGFLGVAVPALTTFAMLLVAS